MCRQLQWAVFKTSGMLYLYALFQDKESRVFNRLVNCCRKLPDPMANVIYPKRPGQGGNKKDKGIEGKLISVDRAVVDLEVITSKFRKVIVRIQRLLHMIPPS